MGDIVVAVGVVLLVVLWAVILLVMLRASNAQRARTKRTDFGGRYTYFGFVFGLLGDKGRREDSGQTRGRESRSDDTGQPGQ